MRIQIQLIMVFFIILLALHTSFSQVKPTVMIVGGDREPALKQKLATVLETVLFVSRATLFPTVGVR
jgi:hypothetical protein